MRHAIRKHMRDFVALVALFAVAIGVSAFILANQRLRFPVVEAKPFVLKAEFSDAQAVVPGQGQTVRVAGMRIGDIKKVELHDGIAVVFMDIDHEHEGVVRKDSTALLRPRTGLKDMFIELDPGHRGAPAMKDGDTIPLANTAPDIDADEILSALDSDTRAYFTLLINGVGKGLDQRGGDLRQVFRRLGPLHRDLARLNSEVAKRRVNLARLVHNYGGTVDDLGKRDKELSQLVQSSSAVFESLASEDENISRAVAQLPDTLDQVDRTLGKVNELGQALPPGLNAMRPAVRQLNETNKQVRPFALEAAPILKKRIRPFVRAARPYVKTVRPAARDLAKASPDLRESFHELNRFFNMLAYNPGGREKLSGNFEQDRARDEGFLFWLAWVSQNSVSVFSTADAQGPFRRFLLSATCTTLLGLRNEEPAREVIMGVGDLLSDPGLCPSS